VKLKFLIAAPVYSHQSGGVMVLHELCDTLNRVGYESTLIFFYNSNDQEQKWQWGYSDIEQYFHPDHTRVLLDISNPDESIREFLKECVIIYPDIIHGNPLGAARVIRYLLYKNHHYTRCQPNEYILSFSKLYSDSADGYLFKTFAHPELNAKDSLHWSQRTLDITYIGKGANFTNCFRIPGTLLITRSWPSTKEELGILLRQCRYFFSWDGATQTNIDAVMCGAIPVVLHELQLTREELAKSELGALPTITLQDFNNKESVSAERAQIDAEVASIISNDQYFVNSWSERVLEFARTVCLHFSEWEKSLSESASKPLVSILIPTHNRPEYLELALKSALAQTYTNIEIVISDNGNTDESQRMVQKYREQDSRIIYSKIDSTCTATDNWVNTMNLSSGEYINYLMDDDLFHETKIERMMEYFLNYPNIGLVTSFRQRIDDKGKFLETTSYNRKLYETDTILEGNSFGTEILKLGLNVIGEPTTVLVKKSDVVNTFGQFCGEQYIVLSDVATWLRLMSNRYCVYIAEPLSYFRIHSGQDQQRSGMVLKGHTEWLRLAIDSYTNNLFLTDKAEFSTKLSTFTAALVPRLVFNYKEIQAGDFDTQFITDTISKAVTLLFNNSPASQTEITDLHSELEPIK